MIHSTETDRKAAGVCIKCEGVPVVKGLRCASCYGPYLDSMRLKMRKYLGTQGRSHWNPETQALVCVDDKDGYAALRAKIALEMSDGATGNAVCAKYQISFCRLQRICRDHGVVMTRKRGGGLHPKTPDRAALEAQVIADARGGMYLRDLKLKYLGHEVRYICERAGVKVALVPESEYGIPKGN